MNERELIQKMAEEIPAVGPLSLTISAMEAFRIAGLLQLVKRHPGLSQDNHYAATWFIAHVKQHFVDCPAVWQVLHMGDNPVNDRQKF
jgi:hypothetical protein